VVRVFERVVGPAARMVAAGGWTRSPSYRAVKERTFPGVTFSDVEQPGGVGAAAIASSAAAGDTPTSLPDTIARFVGTG
jgi:hypothetical protein